MSEAKLKVTKRRAFSAVPDDILTDKNLSIEARAVLSFIVGRPEGWNYYVGQICRAMGVSETRWRRIRAEMQQAGYYRQTRRRGPDGRLVWDIEVSDTPIRDSTIRGKPMDGEPMDGEPMHGEPMHGEPTDRTKDAEQSKSTNDMNKVEITPQRESGESGEPTAPRRRALTRPLSVWGGERSRKYVTDPQTKISLQEGNQADERSLKEIKMLYSQEEISRAVEQVAAGEPSGRAYPTGVLRLLRRARAARAAAGEDDGPAWARGFLKLQRQEIHEIDVTSEGETL